MTVFDLIPLIISAVIFTGAFFCFYCWRSSAFDTVSSHLQNVKRIPDGEKAKIPSVNSETFYICKKRHKPMVYFEYVYSVHGKEHKKSYFYEDDGAPLPTIVKMHYHRKHPRRCYRDGAANSGNIMGTLFVIFGTIMLVAGIFAVLN